jgi:Zn-dependent protease with chaperone function
MFLPFFSLIAASLGLSLVLIPLMPEAAFWEASLLESALIFVWGALALGQLNSEKRGRFAPILARLGLGALWAGLILAGTLTVQLSEAGLSQVPSAQAVIVYCCVLVFWLGEALVAEPFQRVSQKLRSIKQSLRLQFPLIIISGVHIGLFTVLGAMWQEPSSLKLLVELGLSVLVFLAVAPWAVVLCWGGAPVSANLQGDILQELSANHTSVHSVRTWPEHVMRSATAGVIGILPFARFLLISPSLLRNLSSEELRAVVAHEAGHLRKRHLLFFALSFFAFVELLFLAVVGIELTRWLFDWEVPEWMQGVGVLLLVAGFLRLGLGFLSRNFERQADCNALERCGWQPIAQALMKVAQLNRIPVHEDNWHHYGILQRLQFLQKCAEDPQRIPKHHFRVGRIQQGCIAVFVILLSASFYTSTDHARESLILWRMDQMSQEWTAADLPVALEAANWYFQQTDITRAEQLYRQVLVWDPQNRMALNNLAWLLTQHFPGDVAKVKESVHLAEAAIEVEPAAFIWDTLAEAYALDGRSEEAVKAARSALQLAERETRAASAPGLDYYQERMEQFQHAPL